MALSQNTYDKRWRERHRHHANYLSYRSSAKTFIRRYAKYKDLKTMIRLAEKRCK